MRPLDPFEIPLGGTQLIEASAGTGKTFTIALLYLRLVMEQGLGADQILVVTYTNAAVAELRERIRARLHEVAAALEARLATGAPVERGPHSRVEEMVEASVSRGEPAEELERLHRALRGFDEAAIFTIHGFCSRILEENAFESGVAFDTELVPDQRALVADVIADFWTRTFYAAEPDLVAWVRATTRAGQRKGPALLAGLAETVAGQPRIAVIPERAPEVAECPLEARSAALARVQALWADGGAEAVEGLARAAEQGVLSKQSFKPATLRGRLLADVESFLAQPVVGAAASSRAKSGRETAQAIGKITAAAVEKGTRKGQTPPAHPLFDAAGELVALDERCRDAFEARWLRLELDLIAYTRDELARRRRSTRTRSYDELLTSLADALEGPDGGTLAAGIRARFPAALIDEFQDTDPVQYTIFRRVWHGGAGAFFLIGDPKQAIYGFRGADVFAYMQARTDAGDDGVGLDRNWRSDPSVIAAINALFSRVSSPFLYDRIPFQPARPAPAAADRLDARPAGAGMRILFAARGSGDKLVNKGAARPRVAAAMADDVARLLASGACIGDRPVVASDVAVLCRTNSQAHVMQEQLGRRGVPSVMQTQESVFETDEAAALERVLAAAAEPTREGPLRAAITTPLVGVDAAALQAITAHPEGLDPWLERADAWHARWRESGTLSLVESILHEHGARERILAEAGGERRLTNWLHLAELMEAAAHAGRRTPRALLGWLARMRRDAAARAEEAGDDALVRLESDARAVKLVTVHRSKGLQYGIVYCPFLWDDRLLSPRDEAWVRFHDPEANDRLTLDLGSARSEESLGLARYEAFAESLRLLYVALTRAVHRVVVAWGGLAGADTSALGCLLHPPPDFDALVAGRDPSLVDACRTHVKDLSDEDMQADLAALVRAGGGEAVSVEPLPEPAAPRPLAAAPVGSLAPARRLPRPLLQRRHVSSFSRLVADGDAAPVPGAASAFGEEHPAAAGLDYDAAAPALPAGSAPAPAPVPGGAGSDEAPVPLHAFPAGAGPGTLIHHVLEHLDFAEGSRAVLERAAAEGLARFGMPAGLAPSLAAGLHDVLETSLGGALGGFRLAQLTREARIDEMEFVLPVAPGGRSALTPARLADAFAQEATTPVVQRYAARAGALGFAALEGHLRGFVDVIFRHDGRFFLADYKSNLLGPNAGDYAPERLAEEMIRHDYVLQYHLYALALHRFLTARVPGYTYARDFGGVYYLFVRGMRPGGVAGTGIFHDLPPESLVTALGEALGEVAPARLVTGAIA